MHGQNSRKKKPVLSRSLFVPTRLHARNSDAPFSIQKATRDATCPVAIVPRTLSVFRAGRSMSYCEREGEARFVSRHVTQTKNGETDSPEDNRSLGKTRLPGYNPFCSGLTDPPAKQAALTCSSHWLSSAKETTYLFYHDVTRKNVNLLFIKKIFLLYLNRIILIV